MVFWGGHTECSILLDMLLGGDHLVCLELRQSTGTHLYNEKVLLSRASGSRLIHKMCYLFWGICFAICAIYLYVWTLTLRSYLLIWGNGRSLNLTVLWSSSIWVFIRQRYIGLFALRSWNGTCLQMTLSHKEFDLVEGFILLISKGLSIFLSCDLKFCWANLLDRQ